MTKTKMRTSQKGSAAGKRIGDAPGPAPSHATEKEKNESVTAAIGLDLGKDGAVIAAAAETDATANVTEKTAVALEIGHRHAALATKEANADLMKTLKKKQIHMTGLLGDSAYPLEMVKIRMYRFLHNI